MSGKKKILVLDIWRGTQGGASKSALYGELSKLYSLEFPVFRQPLLYKAWKYLASFHPDLTKWKQRKAVIDERSQKYPKTFRMATVAWNEAIGKMPKDYDALLQIGSLFGPVSVDSRVPYFSYHDSAVANYDAKWSKWMPGDFDRVRDEWYSLEKKMFSSMTAIMTYSAFVKETIAGEYGIAPQMAHVVGSALKIPEEYEIDWAARGPQALFVTTDFERKGGYEALEIFETVASRVDGAKLVIAGPVPDDLTSIRRPWLHLAGPVRQSQLIEIYKRSSVLVHPARFDAFPSVILEAANFEVPCVGSRVCAIPEIIIENETGFTVEPGDKALFAEKVIDLFRDKKALEEMGRRARRSVRERFHPSVVAANIKKVMDRHI